MRIAVGIVGNGAKPYDIEAVQTGTHGLEIAFSQDKGIYVLFLPELLKEIGRKERIYTLPFRETVFALIFIPDIVRSETGNEILFEAGNVGLLVCLAHVGVGILHKPSVNSIYTNIDIPIFIFGEYRKISTTVSALRTGIKAQIDLILRFGKTNLVEYTMLEVGLAAI